MSPQLSPHILLRIIDSFVSPIRQECQRGASLDELIAAATRYRYPLSVFLENLILQISTSEYGIVADSATEAYPQLQQVLNNVEWRSRAPIELIELGRVLSRILYDWSDIPGRGYLNNPTLARKFIVNRMPVLFERLLTYATLRSNVPLAEAVKRIQKAWRGLFGA